MTLEVVKFRDVLTVNSIPRFVPGLDEPTLEVVGEDFSSAEEVLVNEVKSSEILILGSTRMWVQVPGSIDRIRTIEVVSSSFTRTTKASKLQFKIGETPKTISGILKLVQLFTKWLLQTPGSDIFNPSRGGGLQEIVGKVITTKRMNSVMSSISQSVDKTVTQITNSQARAVNLPTTERLLSAELHDFYIFEDRMEAVARIRLLSVAGEQALTDLSL